MAGEKDKFLKDVYQYRRAVVLLSAAKTGIFEYFIANHRSTVREVGEYFSWDERAAEIFLNALCALGYLEKKADLYQIAGQWKSRFNKDDYPLVKEWLLHEWRLLLRWIHLPEVLQSGLPFREPEKTAIHRNHQNFILSMAHREQQNVSGLLEKVDLSSCHHLLDLGGGPGLFAIALAEKYEQLHATIFDTPDTEKIARDFFQKSLAMDRLNFRSGDFLIDDLGGPYDAVLISSVLHIYSPQENRDLLKRLNQCMAPGGKIVIRDFLLHPQKTGPVIGSLFAVNMLINTDRGNAYTYQQMKSWLHEVGFKKIKRNFLEGRMLLMEAQKG
jgi:ubiquinone/menaquinone biosynthesis C-methylase UbiE